MNYIIIEDTRAGYDFWGLICDFVLSNKLSNKFELLCLTERWEKCGIGKLQKFLDSFRPINSINTLPKYYFIVDYVPSNLSVIKKYNEMVSKASMFNNVFVIPILCYEYCLLSSHEFIRLLNLEKDSDNDKIVSQFLLSVNTTDNTLTIDKSFCELQGLYNEGKTEKFRTVEKLAKKVLSRVTEGTGLYDNRVEIIGENVVTSLLCACLKYDCCINKMPEIPEKYLDTKSEHKRNGILYTQKRQNNWILSCVNKNSSNHLPTTSEKIRKIVSSSEYLLNVLSKIR